MKIRWSSALIVAVVGLTVAMGAWAQGRGGGGAAAIARVQAAAAKPTPMTADGHPDLTGFWMSANNDPDAGAAPRPTVDTTGKSNISGVPLDQEIAGDVANPKLRWADKSLRPVYKPDFTKTQEDHFFKADYLDPSYSCEPAGVPRIGMPSEIAMTRGAVILLYQQRNIFRVIPTDGRGHEKDADGMAMGDSVGHWDGNTLVVDVVNFSPDTWVDKDGSWHDDNMHVTERFTRKGDTLTYALTVDDPTLFAQPFTPKPVTLIQGAAAKHAGEDYPCVESDRPHLRSDERH